MSSHLHTAEIMETMTVDDPPSPDPGGASDSKVMENPSLMSKWLATTLARLVFPSRGRGPDPRSTLESPYSDEWTDIAWSSVGTTVQ